MSVGGVFLAVSFSEELGIGHRKQLCTDAMALVSPGILPCMSHGPFKAEKILVAIGSH